MSGKWEAASVLAIDIGGTKVALATVGEDGSVIASDQFPTPRLEPEQAIAEILGRARSAATARRAGACGIVLPAIVDDGRITWAAESIHGWDGSPLADMVSRALGMPCRVEFDGYAATLGELWQGQGRGYSDIATLIVGTGIGAGVVHEGRLYRGGTGVAGAVGWIRFPTETDLGRRLEDIASGPAILSAARRLAPRAAYEDTQSVFDAAAGGDPAAAAAVKQAILALVAGVGVIVALLAPELVVLGGSVGARGDVVEAVRRGLADATQPYAARSVRIEASSLGSLSSLFGAAYLAIQALHGKEP